MIKTGGAFSSIKRNVTPFAHSTCVRQQGVGGEGGCIKSCDYTTLSKTVEMQLKPIQAGTDWLSAGFCPRGGQISLGQKQRQVQTSL